MPTPNVSSRLSAALALAAAALCGCALQPPAQTPLPLAPAAWSGAPAPVPAEPHAATAQSAEHWWRPLRDPAVDAFVAGAEQGSPTLARAWARLDEARAQAGVQQAAAGPAAQGSVEGGRGNTQTGGGTPRTSFAASLALSWELDLFGRLRHNQAAADQRLAASAADARSTRLALQAQVADAVVSARACRAQATVRREDVRSRQAALRLTELRLAAGQVSPMDAARSRSSLAEAEISRAGTDEQCSEAEQQLVALTGWPLARVREQLQAPVQAEAAAQPARAVAEPPAWVPALPADVLKTHPAVAAALRNADAAWEDIGAAEAARLPSLSLSALLSTTWLRAAGSFVRSSSWSLTPELSAAVWDGGRGKAQAAAARARWAQALATLESSVRSAVQDVENALALGEGAAQRERLALGGAAAAAQLLRASEASQQAGRMSLFELEDARRGFNNAQLALIGAQRDRARAWVALVKATGNAASARLAAGDARNPLP